MEESRAHAAGMDMVLLQYDVQTQLPQPHFLPHADVSLRDRVPHLDLCTAPVHQPLGAQGVLLRQPKLDCLHFAIPADPQRHLLAHIRGGRLLAQHPAIPDTP